MNVLTDIKTKGVLDILITETFNINGFTVTIATVIHKSIMQICVVHQICNSSKFVVWKDKREFAKEQREIYTAPNREAAKATLENLAVKKESKYSYAIKSWYKNWEELTLIEIRKIIYTTNIIENLNGKIWKYT